jgi:hypothetical protein
MMISIGHQASRHFRTCRKGLYHVDAVGERTDVESNRSHRYYVLNFMATLIPDLRPVRDLALGRQKTMRFHDMRTQSEISRCNSFNLRASLQF